jgi:hypothetical protein
MRLLKGILMSEISSSNPSYLMPLTFDGDFSNWFKLIVNFGPAFVLVTFTNVNPPLTEGLYIRYDCGMSISPGAFFGMPLRVVDLGPAYKKVGLS